MADCTLFLRSLGSGSGGNAFIIESEQQALLVDQGFSCKELLARMDAIHFDPCKICGALLSHEHTDHSKGSRVFCDKLNLPLYTASGTAEYLDRRHALPKDTRTFESGEGFNINNFTVKTISLPHDAVSPVGFVIHFGDIRVGIATDLGKEAASITQALCGCRGLVLESNYDRKMLMESDRSYELKRRILGPRGHLDNCDTCHLLDSVLTPDTELLLLAHVSRECNDPDLVRSTCRTHLQELHYGELLFDVLSQDQPSQRFMLAGEF